MPRAGAGPAQADFEPRWPSALAVLVASVLYASLPSQIISASHRSMIFRVLVPALELALLLPLAVATPHRRVDESGRRRRMLAITLIAVVSLANTVSLGFLLHFLLTAGSAVHGRVLLLCGRRDLVDERDRVRALVLGARRRRAACAAARAEGAA